MLLINGHTRDTDQLNPIFKALFPQSDIEHIYLLQQDISYYDYNSQNAGDDFLPLAQKMLEADAIIFLTPVYWYTMSAVMKTFIDRFSDLITTHKKMGRALAGKPAFLIASGHDTHLPEGFDVPFKLTFRYFNIDYGGSFYYSTQENQLCAEQTLREATSFGKKIHDKIAQDGNSASLTNMDE